MPEGTTEPDSGHRVRLLDLAIVVCDAVLAGDPHLPSRALDLAELVAEIVDAEDAAEQPGRASVRPPRAPSDG